MCSRFSLTSPIEAVASLFKCQVPEAPVPPRYNIAPTDPVHIVRNSPGGTRELHIVRWGLVPGWVKDPREFTTLINARAETVAEKPSFRGAMRHKRCIVPCDGYYEWTGERGAKQPHLIRQRTQTLFGLAGLWETWLGADGSEFDSMAIITTAANADVSHIHDRMPVILPADAYAFWLDGTVQKSDLLLPLLTAPPAGTLEAVAVSRKLNNPRAEGPELQTPA